MTVLGPVYASSVAESAGWTNPSNATGSSNDTPATTTTTGETITLGGFDLSSIASDATLNSVTIGYRYTLTESRNNYSHGVEPMVSQASVGSAVTDVGESGATSGGGNGTYANVSGTTTGVTVAELKDANFQLQASITRTAGTRTFTYSLDSVWVTVDWSPASTAYERTPAEDLGLTDASMAPVAGFERLPSDSADLSDPQAFDRGLGAVDDNTLADSLAMDAAYAVSHDLGMTDDVVVGLVVDATLTDVSDMTDTVTAGLAVDATLSDVVGLTDSVSTDLQGPLPVWELSRNVAVRIGVA